MTSMDPTTKTFKSKSSNTWSYSQRLRKGCKKTSVVLAHHRHPHNTRKTNLKQAYSSLALSLSILSQCSQTSHWIWRRLWKELLSAHDCTTTLDLPKYSPAYPSQSWDLPDWAQCNCQPVCNGTHNRWGQHSNPFANLQQRAIRRCQVNALKAIVPAFNLASTLPCGAYDLGEGFVLLRAAEDTAHRLPENKKTVLVEFMREQSTNASDKWLQCPKLAKWAHLCLPNGQIARFAWKEQLKTLAQLRTSRNVKVCHIPPECGVSHWYLHL